MFTKNLLDVVTSKHLQNFPYDEGIRHWGGPHGQHSGYIKDGKKDMLNVNQK